MAIKIVDIMPISELLAVEGTIVRVILFDENDKRFQHSEIGILRGTTLYINNYTSYNFISEYEGVDEITLFDIAFDV